MKIESIPFKNKEFEGVELEGDFIEAIDIQPKEEKSPIPIFVGPGWLNEPKISVFDEELSNKLGRRVLSLAHSRKKLIKDTETNYPKIELQKSFELLSVLDEKDISQTDAIAYSAGSLNVLFAASMYPEKFRNIVLVNPAGMIGKDNIFSLAKRYSKELLSHKADAKNDIKKVLKYIPESPTSAYNEISAIAKSDIYEILADLKSKGIGISVIAGVDDKVFPMKTIQDNYGSKKLDEKDEAYKKYFDGFYSIQGDHFKTVREPKEHIGRMVKALDALENKYK